MGDIQQIFLKMLKFEFRFNKVTLQYFLAETNLVSEADFLNWSFLMAKDILDAETVDCVFLEETHFVILEVKGNWALV